MHVGAYIYKTQISGHTKINTMEKINEITYVDASFKERFDFSSSELDIYV